MIDYILFFGLALAAIGSALGMLFSKSAIYSALNLVINFVAVAFFYMLLGAPFISLAQVAVYAGAIMVLFLFVIMLLGAERLPESKVLPWQRPLAVILGGILVLEVGYLLLARLGALPPPEAMQESFGTPAQVGLTLFSEYLLPFEVISILLLAAMVGVVALTRRKNRPL